MKKIGKLLLILIASLAMSCDAIPFFENTYYVRFEGECSGVWNESALFAMQAGTHIQTIKALNFSETFGPVSKDARIHITAEGLTNHLKDDFLLKIYVSRNNEPFVLVASTNGVGTASLMYEIDF